MEHWRKLPAILEPLGTASTYPEAQKALSRSLSALVEAARMKVGWGRIRYGTGENTLSMDAGEAIPSFCFPGFGATKCFCEESLAGGPTFWAGPAAGDFCRSRGFSALICQPVTVADSLAGFIFLAGNSSPEAAAELATTFARHAGLMAKRVADAASLDKRLKTLQTISRVGAIITSQLTLAELAQAVVEQLGKVLRTDRVNLVLYNQKEQTLEFIASFFSGEEKRDTPEIYPLSNGMNSWIIRNRRPLLIKSGTEQECARMGIRHGGKPAKSWLGVPMVHNGNILGALSVQSYDEPNLYDASSVELLNLVAAQVAVAVVNAQLYESTERREREKQRLYYSLTHDLLSFVSPVASYGQILQQMDGRDLADRKDNIGRSIAQSAKKITQFVEDILVYSRLDAGKLVLNTATADFYRIVEQSVSNFHSEIVMRKLELYLEGKRYSEDGHPASHMVVQCDILQIERVLNNCIQNALKHAASRIEITTKTAGGEFLCTVADDGMGMPKEMAPKVFDEYYQANRGKKGVGLGLPSVKRIVEQHGGKVWVDTDTGKGFAFTFTLPARQESSVTTQTQA